MYISYFTKKNKNGRRRWAKVEKCNRIQKISCTRVVKYYSASTRRSPIITVLTSSLFIYATNRKSLQWLVIRDWLITLRYRTSDIGWHKSQYQSASGVIRLVCDGSECWTGCQMLKKLGLDLLPKHLMVSYHNYNDCVLIHRQNYTISINFHSLITRYKNKMQRPVPTLSYDSQPREHTKK